MIEIVIIALLLALVGVVCWLLRPQFGGVPGAWEYPEGAESCADVCPNMGACQDCDCGFP